MWDRCRFALPVLALCAVFATGCMTQYARTQDVDKMRAQMTEMQQSMAHLNLRMEELNNSVMILQETARANRESIRGLQTDLEKPTIYVAQTPAMDTNPTRPLPQGGDVARGGPAMPQAMSFPIPYTGVGSKSPITPTAGVSSPEAAGASSPALEPAVRQFQGGNYGLAAYDLAAYLAANPNAADSTQARWYLAESYYQLGDFAQAAREYGLVLARGAGSLGAKATLRAGQCFAAQGLTAKSEEMFRKVVAQYPGTAEADLAGKELAK